MIRTVALIAVAVAAVGSLAFMLYFRPFARLPRFPRTLTSVSRGRQRCLCLPALSASSPRPYR